MHPNQGLTDANTTVNPPVPLADRIEHHEVAEGRVIHGHNMTFHAPVFGEIVSDGGAIRFENTLGWGTTLNPAGSIKAMKRVFNATLQAPGGIIEVASAESCLIIGREVTVREAVKCQIFAHTLRIATASGCMIAARDVDIRHARPHKHEPNMITMVVPDLPDLSGALEPIHAEIQATKAQVDALTARIDAFKADPALAQYLAIRGKVRSGMLKLTNEQTQGYQQMDARLGDTASALEAVVAERRPYSKTLASLTAQAQAMVDAQLALMSDCRCKIARVDGETIVRQLLEPHDDPDLSLIPLPMIPKILFRNDASVRTLCAVHEGTLNWTPGPTN
ncbi:MAG TPA: hypothetical protein PKH72_01200 [Rhodoferax sp.]|jgi:hypothetical protein|nr:hypothetical protein [Rhodoferax sp.]HNV58248.1 hypothetical protein [Rhodoferax sp.]